MAQVPTSQEFKVVIEGLELEAEHAEHLNKVLQSTVLTEIARLNIFPEFAVKLPRDWIGILIRPQQLFD
jgi:hypothetical protein